MKEPNAKKIARVGLMQVTADYGMSVAQSNEHMLHLAEGCLRNGADIVFMPEFYQYKACQDEVVPRSLEYASSYLAKCAGLAQKYRAYVVPWDIEEDNGKFYNTSFIFGREGGEVGRFRKVHLTYKEELSGLSRGDEFKVFDLDFGRVGVMICWDNAYPESAAVLSLKGAELILYPLYGSYVDYGDRWETVFRARAIDNEVYIASAQIADGPFEKRGAYSGLAAPGGEVLEKLEDGGSFKVVEIDLNRRNTDWINKRQGIAADLKEELLKTRNPAAYEPLLKESPPTEWDDLLYKV